MPIFSDIDMANKVGYDEAPTLEFVQKRLAPTFFRGRVPANIWSDKRFNDYVHEEVKGLKVLFKKPDGTVREYRVNGLGHDCLKKGGVVLTESQESITIAQYYERTYKYQVKKPSLPTLFVGNPNPKNGVPKQYVPMELTVIRRQAAPKTKKLSEDQLATMIKQTALPPAVRLNKIKDEYKTMNYKNDGYASTFGITLSDQFETVNARVLNPPMLTYSNGSTVKPNNGSWQSRRLKFVQAVDVMTWGVLTLDNRMTPDKRENFIRELNSVAAEKGVSISGPQYAEADMKRNNVEKKLRELYGKLEAKVKPKKPDFIMCIVGGRGGGERDLVKFIADTELGIPTGFVLSKHVLKANRMTLGNIVLKINSKLGGINQSIKPGIMLGVDKGTLRPIMYIGADVTHPSPDQLGAKPSIAAIVGSVEPGGAIYKCQVSGFLFIIVLGINNWNRYRSQ